MDGSYAIYGLRERTAAVLEAVAAGQADAGAAAQLLADLRATWIREKRWRNTAPPVRTRHVAGPVIDCREYRRSCPLYIVDRRQACSECGKQLVRGRWAMFFAPGSLVAALGTTHYSTAGEDGEISCRQPSEGEACAESA